MRLLFIPRIQETNSGLSTLMQYMAFVQYALEHDPNARIDIVMSDIFRGKPWMKEYMPKDWGHFDRVRTIDLKTG